MNPGPLLAYGDTRHLVASVLAQPGKYSYASAGIGNVTHLATELFLRQAGMAMVHVPYKGAQAVIADLLGGHISLTIVGIPLALI